MNRKSYWNDETPDSFLSGALLLEQEIEIIPFSVQKEIGKIKNTVSQDKKQKKTEANGKCAGRESLNHPKKRVENEAHKDSDGGAPCERREKGDISADMRKVILIIPQSDMKDLIEEKTCEKLKYGGEKSGQKIIGDVPQKRMSLQNAFPENFHILRCVKKKINGDDGSAVDGTEGKNEKSAIVWTLQNECGAKHFPKPTKKRNEDTRKKQYLYRLTSI